MKKWIMLCMMSAAVVGVMRFTGIAGIDKRLMMKTFDEVLVLSTNLTVANQKLISDAMDRAVDEAGSFPPKIFTRLLLPALGNASAKFLKVETERRLLLIAIHVEQYRLLHEGRLPDSLDELNSKLFVRDVGDVFEGVLIQFTPTESGYHINTSLSESGDSASSVSGTVDTFSLTIVHYYESDEE